MATKFRSGFGVAGFALGVAATSYAAYAGSTWYRYGHPTPPDADEADRFLDGFMPLYDVVERHHLAVAAPADVTFAAAMKLNLEDSVIIRAIFKTRELVLGSNRQANAPSGTLVDVTTALGWRALVEVPGREIVMGAVTQPWKGNVVFRGIPPEEFAGFAEPDYAKILWTLRADPVDPARSIARTETRVVTTDAHARSAFRTYWSCVSPGVALIRLVSLHLVKTRAEAAWRNESEGRSASASAATRS